MKRLLYIFLLLIIALPCDLSARKIGYKIKSTNKEKTAKSSGKSGAYIGVVAKDITPADTVGDMVNGSFMVASYCESCNNGYRLDQLKFSGFDKKLRNSKESFFIKNLTDRTLTGVVLYIDYRTPDGRQLTKRLLKLTCDIPSGETRKADIPTFDAQHSFYYIDSESSKRGGNPFKVTFDPVAYYLRY